MTKGLPLRVNSDRMLAAFNELALIGATGAALSGEAVSKRGGGVNRPALSDAHLAARKWFREQVEASGLEFHTDGAGNHSAVLASSVIASEAKQSLTPAEISSGDPSTSLDEHSLRSGHALATLAPRPGREPSGAKRPGARAGVTKTLLVGSHLDSVPNGGRFDGTLGVMAALEVLRTIKDNGIRLKVNLEAIDFTDEEGTLVGLLGSAAAAGHLSADTLQNPRGGREALIEGMTRAGLSDDSMLSAARPKSSLAGYLELHIEQGRRLERAGIKIGIVSAIVGISSYRLSFIGRADHAGTTTMQDRLDASLGASAFTLAARELVMRDFADCVVNVGKMDFAPGAFNIVPAQVDLSLEFRAPNDADFDRLDGALMGLAHLEAKRFGLDLKTDFRGRHSPTPMSDSIQRAFVESCNDLGLTHTSLVSGAGHDGQSFADVCPVGMIFVPSRDGASHAPREFTEWQDCVNGANVLLQTVLKLAGE